MEAQYDALVALTGSSDESPLMRAIADLQSLATMTVQELIDDKNGWCCRYWLKSKMGAEGMTRTINGKPFSLRTVDDLAAIITEHANA